MILPIALGFARQEGLSVDGEKAAIRAFLQENVQGDWSAVALSTRKRSKEGRLLDPPKTFAKETRTDCFLALVGGGRIYLLRTRGGGVHVPSSVSVLGPYRRRTR